MGKLEITEVFESTMDVVAKVKAGDMSGPEAMLVSQASAFNSIFTELARRAAGNMGEYMSTMESNPTAGAEGSSAIPGNHCNARCHEEPADRHRSASDIANGPQQVTNGPLRAGNQANVLNELLEVEHGERLDPRTASQAGRVHPPLVAVETSNRASDASR